MGRYQIPFDIHNNMKLLAAASALGLAAAAVPSDWNQFKARFGKTYKSSAEESRRFAIYKENLAFIARHNADAATGKESYTVGVNHFADLTNAEFRTQYLADMAPGIRLNYQCPVNFVDNGNTADSADWRSTANPANTVAVTSVKDRDRAVPAGVLAAPPLLRAPCASMACNGGWIDNALYYVLTTGYLDGYDSYPYESGSTKKAGTCVADPANTSGSISNCGATTKNSETELTAALSQVGPVGIAIDAGGIGFQLYSGGVYVSNTCSSSR